jgi:hypothetical protein
VNRIIALSGWLMIIVLTTGCSQVGLIQPEVAGGPRMSGPSLEHPATDAASLAEPTRTIRPPTTTGSRGEAPAARPTPTPLVPLSEIISGGPPPDGIPPIDEPRYISTEEADEWLADREPVIAVELNGVARAFPLQIMTWHEIVNTEFDGKPAAVTYCPLCNTALVFDREVDGTVYDFGTSGRLYKSALVMYDRQTGSWWSQVLGQAIVGKLTGTHLELLPSAIVSWRDFKATYPGGLALSRETGHPRPYGANPYARYDQSGQRPFLFRGEIDRRLDAMERVVGMELNGAAKAYPFSTLAAERVVADTVGGEDIVIFYYAGTASALDQNQIAESRDVGAAAVFRPVTKEGRELTFVPDDGDIVDEQTGSVWNVLGKATRGELEGQNLEPIVHGNHFWFAWAAFNPETDVYE